MHDPHAGSHSHGHGDHAHGADGHMEMDDVKMSVVLWFLVGLFLLTAASFLGMVWTFNFLDNRERVAARSIFPLAQIERENFRKEVAEKKKKIFDQLPTNKPRLEGIDIDPLSYVTSGVPGKRSSYLPNPTWGPGPVQNDQDSKALKEGSIDSKAGMANLPIDAVIQRLLKENKFPSKTKPPSTDPTPSSEPHKAP